MRVGRVSLQQEVKASHDLLYKSTPLKERLRDLQHQMTELAHAESTAVQIKEIGDVGWALLQLANETDADFEDCVRQTINTLNTRVKGRKIALIGTSANPITNAHLTLGLEVLALTDVDEVWYLLVGKHPWGKTLIKAEHRLNMAHLATAKYANLKVLDYEMVHEVELEKAGVKETADLLINYIYPNFPDCEFSWVMGSDVAQTFYKWTGHERMVQSTRIIVIDRPDYPFTKGTVPLDDPKHLYLTGMVTTNISSTLVRQRGSGYDETQVRALIPDSVWDYIKEHRLFDAK